VLFMSGMFCTFVMYNFKTIIMKTLTWDGEYTTLKQLFLINNAVKVSEYDRDERSLVLHLSSGDRKVKEGEIITRDEDGNVS